MLCGFEQSHQQVLLIELNDVLSCKPWMYNSQHYHNRLCERPRQIWNPSLGTAYFVSWSNCQLAACSSDLRLRNRGELNRRKAR